MNKERPVHLNLLTMKFPSTAIISILHRISGFLLFLLLPCILLALRYSLISPEGFTSVQTTLHTPLVKVIVWLLLASIIHHVLAGIRHLIMDWGIGESLVASKATAWLVFVCDIILIVLIGVWLWV